MFILIVVASLLHTCLTAPLVNSQANLLNSDRLGYYDPKAFYNLDKFEGDILGTYPTRNATPGISPYHAIVDAGYLWPNGQLVYSIDSSLEAHRGLIKQAMDHISTASGGCIKFKERTYEPAYVYMYQSQGCYSQVGRQGGAQELSLGRGCHVPGVVIHELLHALGFYHHHSRSDRDKYLRINYENIDPQAYPQFQKLNDWENQLFTDFDYGSIMIYGSTAFSRDGYSKTMTPINPGHATIQDPGYKYGMTQKDIEALKKLYKCGTTGGGVRGIWPHDTTTDSSDDSSEETSVPSTQPATSEINEFTETPTTTTTMATVGSTFPTIDETTTEISGEISTQTLTLVTIPGSGGKILTPPPPGSILPEPELPEPRPPFLPSLRTDEKWRSPANAIPQYRNNKKPLAMKYAAL